MRDALRALADPVLGSWSVTQVTPGPVLERFPLDGELPRLEAAAPIEGASVVARRPDGEPVAGFGAFLDGIQESRVLVHWAPGVPVVHGMVAAVIRVRIERRLRTWRGAPALSRGLYVPASLAGPARLDALRVHGVPVTDTLEGEDAALSARHPQELLALARTAVQRRRELLETRLAEAWCADERSPLFIDGGIAGAGAAARSGHAVGVVKSHRTLYVDGDALGVVTGLRAGERTTAFVVASQRRTAVASWYLRLRDAAGGDPFFGLVRVEANLEQHAPERSDLISRWILAERAPVSLPDPRWSTMAYGIRDCEEYLRSVVR